MTSYFLKLLGLALISFASLALGDLGYGVTTWQWWLIICGPLAGATLIRYSGRCD